MILRFFYFAFDRFMFSIVDFTNTSFFLPSFLFFFQYFSLDVLLPLSALKLKAGEEGLCFDDSFFSLTDEEAFFPVAS